MINYIKEHEAFMRFADQRRLSAHARLTWYALLSEMNARVWPDEAAIADEIMLVHVPFQKRTLRAALSELAELGLVEVQTTGKRGAIPVYKMHYLSTGNPQNVQSSCNICTIPCTNEADSSYSQDNKQKTENENKNQCEQVSVSQSVSSDGPTDGQALTITVQQTDLRETEAAVRRQIGADRLGVFFGDRLVDELVLVITDTLATGGEGFRVGGQVMPPGLVLDHMRRLTETSAGHVLRNLASCPSEITSMRNYLRAALYNAPMEAWSAKARDFIPF